VNIEVRYMVGRCANGAGLDSGPLYHAIVSPSGADNGGRPKALCGRAPKLMWSQERLGQAVTCPKCARKLARVTRPQRECTE